MKTCNGCEHLIKLFGKSIDKKYLYVCVGEAKYGIAKTILETDKEGKTRKIRVSSHKKGEEEC